MKKIVALFLIVLAMVILAFVWLRPDGEKVVLQVWSPGADVGIIKPVATAFEEEVGGTLQFAGEEPAEPDLIIGSRDAMEKARKEGRVRELIDVVKRDGGILTIAITENSEHSGEALKFARYLSAPEKGGRILEEAGFEVIPGDTWEEKPDLILYSGSVNRPAVEELLREFSDREGISITTVFNGCGILCAAMQTMSDSENPRFPDAYYACDLCFVPPVAEHFRDVVLLTETDIGIVVPKGNPREIRTLADLARPGLKVGLCNQKQSTLGYMTEGILKSSGLEKSIRKNLSVEVPTADYLITQLRSGALDAAIVYRVNAEIQKEHLEFLKINHEGARAIQPFSVRSDSDKSHLARRLQDHFVAHPEMFEETGFTWRGDEGVMPSSEIEIPEWLRPR